MLTLQVTAFNHAELECAHAKSAEMRDAYARILDEIGCAMHIPLGSAVRLVNAVHGLGNAPQSWWLSIDQFSDPTVWCFSTEGLGTTYELVAAYVDDFIITGFLERNLTNSRMLFVNDSVGVHAKYTIVLDQTFLCEQRNQSHQC